MQRIKQSVARQLPVILIQKSDGQTPKTGATAGQMTLSYRKEGATSWSNKTVFGNWTEVGKGAYLISWSATDLNTVGRFDAVAEHADCINGYVAYQVSANLLDDIKTAIDALNDLDAAEILAAITSDSTKFAGANINAAISSRSSHTANNVRDAILSDSTPFAGASIDATISSRSSHTAAAVVALMNDLSAAEVLAAITTDTTKFAGANIGNLDALVSSRSSHSAADVIALMNDPTVAAIVAGIWGAVQSGYTTPGTFGYYLDAAISSVGGGCAPRPVATRRDAVKAGPRRGSLD